MTRKAKLLSFFL